jgi:predicted AAA+ superfamily ATPase
MIRTLSQSLQAWKTDPLRKPLILIGARQVGKSYLARQLGESFESFIEINFETQPSAKNLFSGDLTIKVLLTKLRAYTEKNIEPGKTLLFLDEIQECEEALLSLRSFKEELPDLHVIVAGSLINFQLNKVGVPVGRVEFRHVYPLSFEEYLIATNKKNLLEYANSQIIDSPFHEILLEELHHYFWLGGMPAVIDAWITFHDPIQCQAIQDDILSAYRRDFLKYAKAHQIPYVEKVFAGIGRQIGQKFKYSDIDQDMRSSPLKEALLLLQNAEIAHLTFHTSAQGLPLSASINDRQFKVFFFDIGLLQRLRNLSLKEWMLTPLSIAHIGAMSEQFVAQEYLAYQDPRSPGELFYWHREGKQNNAEIDFVFVHEGKILPVEVKSTTAGHLKSLREFLKTHPLSEIGLKISEHKEKPPSDSEEKVHAIPFYKISKWA